MTERDLWDIFWVFHAAVIGMCVWYAITTRYKIWALILGFHVATLSYDINKMARYEPYLKAIKEMADEK